MGILVDRVWVRGGKHPRKNNVSRVWNGKVGHGRFPGPCLAFWLLQWHFVLYISFVIAPVGKEASRPSLISP